MEISKPYKGKGKRKIKKMPFTVKGYILYYVFFWVVIISIYLAYYQFMPKITYKDFRGDTKKIEVENGLTVMEGAIQNEIPGIDADCGGSMACATCHIYVDEKWLNKIPKAEEAEEDMIDMAFEPKKNSRLSCQIIVNDELDGLEVTTPEKQT